MRLAVIGDYGIAGPALASVADMLTSMEPDHIFTLGDNNYPDGELATLDVNVGQYFREYISPYLGVFGPGSDVNRFWPALGNHDWRTPDALPYRIYFTLPGNERYYDVRHGHVHAFIVDSDDNEPDGIVEDSLQGQWLQARLAASTAPYKFVFMHHSPYSSSDTHGPDLDLQWPYAQWGADAVFAGHDHLYERLDIDGLSYYVNGIGGNPTLYPFAAEITAGSRTRYRRSHGAQIIDVNRRRALIHLVSNGGSVFDQFTVFADDARLGPEFFAGADDEWRFLDEGTDPGSLWTMIAFDDSTWGVGSGHFGYGDNDEDTTVDFGPDSNNKYITTHFRRTFFVANPSEFTELRLDLLRDDGAVAYLNGVSIGRTNLPAGPIDITTTALVAVSGDQEDSLYDHDVDPSLLAAGMNVLAVEIHQVSATSSDISFAASLFGYRGSQMLVAPGSNWSYLDDGSDPGAAWTQLGFDDALWLFGAAELGYGDGGEATVVSFGPDPASKYTTTYFRHEFTLSDAGDWNELILRLLRDDGAIVHLNGREVYRYNLPFGAVDGSTPAAIDVLGNAESAFFETRIDHRKLRTGLNVLAVEIHQDAPDTPDLSFDLELLGRR